MLGMKRPMAFEDAPGKFANIGGAGVTDGDGEWTCEKCGNQNRAGRMYCNMRKCQAPGPWTCPSCGNKNFATRNVCNARFCGMPRPPPPGGGGNGGGNSLQQAVSTMMTQIPGLAQNPALAHMLQGAVSSGPIVLPAVKNASTTAPPGSWKCASCGNVNFPTRDTCNAKNCGLSRAECDGGPATGPADKRDSGPPPEGSWVCNMCQNINWPTRETCNRKACGAARYLADGGSPTPGAKQPPKGFTPSAVQGMSSPMFGMQGMQGMQAMMGGGGGRGGGGGGGKPEPPEGSWVCSSCQNINWPTRDTCNAKDCGQPRSVCDAGPPAPGQRQRGGKGGGTPPEGSWVCSMCQNVNWPTRDTCNGKTCGAARSVADAGPPTASTPQSRPIFQNPMAAHQAFLLGQMNRKW